MATVDSLQINIKASSTDADKALRKLLKTLNEFKKLDNADLNAISRSFNSLNASISRISAVNIRKVERLADALERLKKLKTINVKLNYTRTTTTVGGSGATTPDAETVPPTGSAEASTDEATSAGEKVKEEAQKATTAFDRLKKAAANAGKVATTAFKGMAGSLLSAVKLVGRFLKALARVAFYRFVRFILKTITDGLKEGTENLVMYSKALNNMDSAKANETMSQLATTLLYVKNSVGAAAMPIIQSLTPALVKMAHVAVMVINVINQLVSILQGKNTYTKAKEYWVDYADSLDKTKGSAKALQKQLAGFDELNNLTTSAGGSGGGGLELDPTKMFEESAIDSKWVEVAEKIKDIFEEIKKLIPVIGAGILAWKISSALANALSALGLLSKGGAAALTIGFTLMVTGFALEGTGIKDIIMNGINGLNFGETIGGAILASIGSFLFGGGIAALFGGGALLTSIIGGLGTALAGFGMAFAGIWSSVVEGIDWLSAILTGLGTALSGAGIGAIVGAIVGALGGPIGAGAGAALGAGVGAFIGIVTNMVIAVVQHWTEITTFLSETWTSIINFGTVMWERFSKKFSEVFEKLKTTIPVVVEFLKKKIQELPYNIAYAIGFIAGTVVGKIMEIKNWLIINVPIMIEETMNFIRSLPDKIKTVFEQIITYLQTIPGKVKNVLTEVKAKFDEWKTNLENWIKTEVPKIINSIVDWFKNLPEAMVAIGKNIVTGIWNGIASMGTFLWDHVKSFFGALWDTIKDAFKGLGEGFQAGYVNVPQYANGGFVGRGELFIANENGAEMIGDIGGSTAVANNQMITEAIAAATYRAMSQALSENGLSVTIEGDTDKMFKVMRDKSRDFRRDTGRSAFA